MVALNREQIKREMKRRKGHTFASYSRLVKRSKGAITRLADGEIGGDLRTRFLKFFGFSEKQIPRRKPVPFSPARRRRRR